MVPLHYHHAAAPSIGGILLAEVMHIRHRNGYQFSRFGQAETELVKVYGNRDCQASEGFADHAAEGDADGCCCNQIFSR